MTLDTLYVTLMNVDVVDFVKIDRRSIRVIEYNGDKYVTATEVAQRFHISRATCYSNILQHLQACYLPGRKKAMYRQSEVEQFSEVRIVVACQQGVPNRQVTSHPA